MSTSQILLEVKSNPAWRLLQQTYDRYRDFSQRLDVAFFKTSHPIPFKSGLKFLCHFCGGKSCKHENWKKNPRNPQGLDGLNCDWIHDQILATQRPSSRIIKEYNLIDSFKKEHIMAIFCLQEPGEHPHCGDGIHQSSGLSYLPEEFYKRLF